MKEKRFINWILFLFIGGMFFATCDLRDPDDILTGGGIITNSGAGSFATNSNLILIFPTVKFLSPTANEHIETPYSIRILIEDDKALAVVPVFVLAGTTNALSNEYNGGTSNIYRYELQSMPNGYHTAIVSATDSDGNASVAGMTVIVENSIGTPSVTWTSPVNNDWISSRTLSGTVAVYNGELDLTNPVSLLTNGGLAGYATVNDNDWEIVFDASGYTTGSTVSLSVTARADSMKTVTNTITVKIDNTPPTLFSISPTNGQTVINSGFTVSGQATDEQSGIKRVWITIPSVGWSAYTSATNFNVAFDGVLYGGDYEMIVTVSNKAGLSVAVTNTISAPNIPQVDITNLTQGFEVTNDSIVLAGTAKVSAPYTVTNIILEVTNPDVSYSSAVNPTPGDDFGWSHNLDLSSLGDGTYYIKSVGHSTVTNNRGIATAWRVIKDLDAPSNVIDTSTVVTNRQDFQYNLTGESFDFGAGLEWMYVLVSNYQPGIDTNYFGIGGVSNNWSRDITISAGTNLVMLYSLDQLGRKSTVTELRIVSERTRVIDGENDFNELNEKFSTTDSGIDAYVTWDASNIYVAYDSGDINNAGDADHIFWVQLYISTNTNASVGLTKGVNYSGQEAYLPFKAHYHFRVKADNSWRQLMNVSNNGWVTNAISVSVAHTEDFMEIAVPRAELGNRDEYYVTAVMLYEDKVATDDSTYAGLYSDNFTQGFDPDFTKYVRVDFSDLTTDPNASVFKRDWETVPPTVSIVLPTNETYSLVNNVTVSGTAADAHDSVANIYVSTNGVPFWLASGTENWSFSYTGLGAGTYTNHVFAEDAKGNISTNEVIFKVFTENTYASITVDGTGGETDWDNLFDMNDSSSDSAWTDQEIGDIKVAWDANNLYLLIHRPALNGSGPYNNDGMIIYMDNGLEYGQKAFHSSSYSGAWQRNTYFPNHDIQFIFAAYNSMAGGGFKITNGNSSDTTGLSIARNTADDFDHTDVYWEIMIPFDQIWPGGLPTGAAIQIAGAIVGGNDDEVSADINPGGSNNGSSDTWISSMATYVIDENSDGTADALW